MKILQEMSGHRKLLLMCLILMDFPIWTCLFLMTAGAVYLILIFFIAIISFVSATMIMGLKIVGSRLGLSIFSL